MVTARVADIRVLNTTTETPPPIPLDDFPDDYTCTASKLIGNGKIKTWWSNRCNAPNPRMHLSIQIPEPAVLHLDHSLQKDTVNAIDLIAKINLRTFSFHVDEANAPPEELHVTMSWLLRTTTFVSVVPMGNMPTLTETASDPYTARSSSSTPLRTAKMVLRDWSPATIETSAPTYQPFLNDTPRPQLFAGTKDSPPKAYEAQWQASERLHLTLSGLSESSTTFSTPYISRRHCVHLQLECRSQNSAAVQFKFRVPVQIALTRTARITYQGTAAAAAPPPSRTASLSEPLEILRGGSTRAGREVVASPVYSR